jgi:hypothetical protein
MLSKVFGDLEYQYGWIGKYELRIFGATLAIKLVVPCDEGADIEPAQMDAFVRFEESGHRASTSLESTLFDYYLAIVEERRAMAGPGLADTVAPVIETPDQLAALIAPTELIVQQSLGSKQRVIGLLFRCSWDPELGLAVKFVDERIHEIGPQDIVL